MEEFLKNLILAEFKAMREENVRHQDDFKKELNEMRIEINSLFRNGPISQLQKGVSALKVKTWIILVIGGFLAALLIEHLIVRT